jgi:hypothetical protein
VFSGWRSLLLALIYAVTGVLFILAVMQLAPSGPGRNAIVLCGAGLLAIFLGARFLGAGEPTRVGLAWPLILCWSAAAASIVIGLTEATPAGPARQFVLFGSIGVALALLGWRFFGESRFTNIPINQPGEETQQDTDTRRTRDILMAFCYVGAAGILLYAVRSVVPAGPVENMFQVLGAGTLVACGSLLSGALFGFLFGIPRAQTGAAQQPAATSPSTTSPAGTASSQTAAPVAAASTAGAQAPATQRSAFDVNTNLEQISDWLTKIIVGLGLINLEKFPAYLHDLATYFARSLGKEGSESVVLALIILFFVCGFLLGYLLTRLFLARAFTRAQELSPTARLQRALQTPVPVSTATELQESSPAVIAAIRHIDQAASQVPQDQIDYQVHALASEYDVTRGSMRFSAERTRRLDQIVVRMKGLAKQAYSMLPSLARGDTPGERVAAIAFLQILPDPTYLDWLADRFHTETPFVMYHTALALRSAVDNLGATHRESLRRAIEKAISNTPRKEADTMAILNEAKTQLDSLGEPTHGSTA